MRAHAFAFRRAASPYTLSSRAGVALNKKSCTLNIVTELLALGALYDIVHGKHWDIDWRMLLRLAFDAAKGCIFLHGRKPPVVHCDLKSPNVLVSADWLGKLGDFGLSNMAEHTLKGKAVADVKVKVHIILRYSIFRHSVDL